MHPRQWNIVGKLGALAALGVVVALAVGAVAVVSGQRVAYLRPALVRLSSADHLLGDVLAAEGDVRSLARDAAAAPDEQQRAAALQQLAAETAGLRATLDALDAQAVGDLADLRPVVAQTRTWLNDVQRTGAGNLANSSALHESVGSLRTELARRQGAVHADMVATIDSMNRAVVVTLLAGIALLLALSRWIGLLIARPLGQIAEASDKLAAGDTNLVVDVTGVDEAGQALLSMDRIRGVLSQLIADAGGLVEQAGDGRLSARADGERHPGAYREIVEGINRTLDAVTGPIEAVAEVLHVMARGDLTVRIETEFRGDLEQLRRTVNTTLDQISRTVEDVVASADQLAEAAGQISTASSSLSDSASEQAAAVEETSSSVEQMSASITRNHEHAASTNLIATAAAEQAEKGGEAVRLTVDAMREIASRIAVIDEIAFQTNMLALNATIEAARAGERGNGFAVVATEIGKLADRSQVAAGQIGKLADASAQKAEHAGALIDELVPSIRSTSDLVQEIAAACAEQAVGIEQITIAMHRVTRSTSQTAASSEQLAATAEAMLAQASGLRSLMTFFRTPGGIGSVGSGPLLEATVGGFGDRGFGDRGAGDRGVAGAGAPGLRREPRTPLFAAPTPALPAGPFPPAPGAPVPSVAESASAGDDEAGSTVDVAVDQVPAPRSGQGSESGVPLRRSSWLRWPENFSARPPS